MINKLVIFLIVLFSVPVFAFIPFSEPQVLIESETESSSAIRAGDLDGDGDMDVVVASTSYYDSRVSWYENDGSGHFGRQKIITTPFEGVNSLFIADIDGDNDMDVLAKTQSDGKFSFFKNDGSGNFGEEQVLLEYKLIGVQIYANLTEIDGDGDPDIVIQPDFGSVYWLENDGLGHFGNKQEITTSFTYFINHTFIADVDSDGDNDILSTISNIGFSIQKNNGSGQFGKVIIDSTSTGSSIRSIADLDGDGHVDLIANPSDYEPIIWLKNDGTGNFQKQPNTIINDNYMNVSKIIDLDGDNDLDVIASSSQYKKIAWYKNDGAGNFDEQQVNLNSIQYPLYAFADLDGDGDVDIIASSSSKNSIAWYCNNGAGQFTYQETLSQTVNRPATVVTVDLDGDSLLDILTSSRQQYYHDIAWYKNMGAGDYGKQQTISCSVTEPLMAEAVDLDGDTDLDVLTASVVDKNISWFENDGNGQFGQQKTIATLRENLTNISIQTSDFDADGDFDILCGYGPNEGNSGSEIAIFENKGSGQFEKRLLIKQQVRFIRDLYVTDLDKDGDMDVMAAYSENDVICWYKNDGTGQFGTQQNISSRLNVPIAVCAADMDGDGDLDAISGSRDDGKIAWYKNDGNGNFGNQMVLSTSESNLSSVWAQDMDRDGDVDVCSFSISLSIKVNLFENDGSGHFWRQQIINAYDEYVRSIYPVDLDRDGDLDLVSTTSVDNQVAWYENLSEPPGPGQVSRIPENFYLSQNYPNPFNPVTQIDYHVSDACWVKLSVYNTNGQLVKELINTHQSPGEYTINVNMPEYPSGVYLYEISMGQYNEIKTMVKIK